MGTNLKSLESFERAFSGHTAGCRRKCECGRTYYDNANSNVYDWEDAELEQLRASDAVPLDYAPGDITFEGRIYVDGCTCWHDRARRIIAFIDGHAHAIAEYLTLEKKRKQAEAVASPLVK
jgi:hypothetical protein